MFRFYFVFFVFRLYEYTLYNMISNFCHVFNYFCYILLISELHCRHLPKCVAGQDAPKEYYRSYSYVKSGDGVKDLSRCLQSRVSGPLRNCGPVWTSEGFCNC